MGLGWKTWLPIPRNFKRSWINFICEKQSVTKEDVHDDNCNSGLLSLQKQFLCSRNWFARLIQVENTPKISQPSDCEKLVANLWLPILTNRGILEMFSPSWGCPPHSENKPEHCQILSRYFQVFSSNTSVFTKGLKSKHNWGYLWFWHPCWCWGGCSLAWGPCALLPSGADDPRPTPSVWTSAAPRTHSGFLYKSILQLNSLKTTYVVFSKLQKMALLVFLCNFKWK